jgi:hypothetical protein
MVTGYAARAAGLADRVGSLTPGKAADVILLRTDGPGLTPMRSPAEALVLAAHPGLVDTVLVAGQVAKRAGRLLADVGRARDLAIATADRFTASLTAAQPEQLDHQPERLLKNPRETMAALRLSLRDGIMPTDPDRGTS